MQETSYSSENVTQLTSFLTCKDYLVTGELFDLKIDQGLQLLSTHPQPLAEKLPKYYESSAYISHTDEQTSFLGKVYAGVKSYTVAKKWQLVQKFVKKKGIILDVGCGTGTFLAFGKKIGWKIDGVELASQAALVAENNVENSIKTTIFDSYFDDKQYDAITLWHVLEHLPDTHKHIERLKKMLKPEGILIIAVPNFKSYDAKYYGQYWAAYDVPRHLYHFSQQAINTIVNQHRMYVISTMPMIFDAYYVSLLSEQYISNKKNWIKAFWIGFVSNFLAFFSSKKEYSSLIYVINNNNSFEC